MRTTRIFLLCLGLAQHSVSSAAPALVVPSPAQLRWQTNEIEALVHFGLNTMTGQEWGSGQEKPQIFSPTNLVAAEWVSTAESFNAKALILVCKHHDGFCLWPSSFTDYSVKASPWRDGKGDLVREVSDACRKTGLGFGIYLSPSDLHEPSFGRDHQKYNDYFCNQLRELLTQYGPISQVFFDGANPPGFKQHYDFPRYYRLIRELQPNAVISVHGPDVRWVGNESGRARATEWSVIPLPRQPEDHDWADMMAEELGSRAKLKGAAALHWYPAVADVSLRQGWFWNETSQTTLKSLDELMRTYEFTVGRNAGLQLNLLPDRTGQIPKADANRLKEFGDRLRASFATNLLSLAAAKPGTMEKRADETWAQSVELGKTATVKYVVLQEDIRKGQRVEKFEVEAIDTFGSSRVLKATTIGWKRILKLEMPQVKMLKVTIRESRAEPWVTVAAY